MVEATVEVGTTFMTIIYDYQVDPEQRTNMELDLLRHMESILQPYVDKISDLEYELEGITR